VTEESLAIAFARAIEAQFGRGNIDAREVAIACVAVLDGYVGQLPAEARMKITDHVIAEMKLIRVRGTSIPVDGGSLG
jgi:hypothetical protein